jgi:hypothetical protein
LPFEIIVPLSLKSSLNSLMSSSSLHTVPLLIKLRPK